ncbi:MAG: ATP-binding cassette domain-containing protein [Bacteroidetes bacterium]|nr:ATP-binding cassette domain-containing protein [Bacteroidota bacterium]
MITLKSVWKGFQDQSILEDISLSIPNGEKLCVIGQSGIGKSVMMKLMVGLLQPDKGEIWIEGQNVTEFRPKDWTPILRDFGVVFQGAALFDSLNVLENVGIRMIEERSAKPAEIKERVAESLKQVGLEPNEVLTKYPSELSGGMQKRVGIARAIVNKPKYIFYDEPTTGLDPVNSGRIDELMNTLAQEQGRTSIIITHDMYTVKTIATQVAMIHDRRLHFHGTPKEFLDSQDPEIQRFLARA